MPIYATGEHIAILLLQTIILCVVGINISKEFPIHCSIQMLNHICKSYLVICFHFVSIQFVQNIRF